MSDHPEAHRLGEHLLGPHVVGQRIVVRRVVPGEVGPSGGPALTDVLGVCVRWSDAECVVQPDAGPAVTIPLALVVAGKPVPPRPSPRFRVSPRECHVRAGALFPDLVTEPLGEWLMRSSATSSARRANSVLAFGPAQIEDAYERVVAHYAAHDARPYAQVEPGSPGEALFRDHGWLDEGHTHFQLASVARVTRALPTGLPDGVELDSIGPGLVQARLAGGTTGGATGVAAYADDWVGFRGVEVAPDHRGGGLALAVMAALLEWGAAQGATTAYLQVLADNEPAHRLYDGLGFTTHHTYCYLSPPR